MRYRWQIDSHLEIYARRPARRYLVQTLGGQFPVLQRLHDGTIACVARGGDFHVGERGYLTWTTSTDGGESWDFARPLGPFGLDDRGPCFIQTREGTLLIAFQNGPFYENGRYSARLQRTLGIVQLIRSGDLGRNWEHAGALPFDGDAALLRGALPFGKMAQLDDGTILMPVYGGPPDQGAWALSSTILRSRDDGRSWGDATRIAAGFNETQLLPLPSGTLIAMLRRNYEGRERRPDLWQAESSDGGYTWGSPRRITDHGEHPADLARLGDGRLLLTYGYRNPPYGVRALVSRDDGRSWDKDRAITLVAESASSDCGYPSSVQREDGTILTAYYADRSHGPFTDEVLRDQHIGAHCAVVAYDPADLP